MATSGGEGYDWRFDYLQDRGVVSGDSVKIFTTGDLYDIGGSIIAGSELSLIAGGNIVIAPQTIEVHWDDGSKKNGGKVDDVVNHGGTVLSGGSAVLIAGGELDVIGSSVHADGDLTLAALTGDVNIVASVDVTDHTVNDDGKETRDIHVRNNGSDVTAGGDLTIVSAAGDVTIQASHLGGDSITISAADTVHFATGTDEDIHTETGKTSNLITQTTYNNGHSEQRLVYDTMDIGPGGLSIEAQQVIVDYLESITNKTYDKKGNEQITGVVTQSPMDVIAQVIDNPGMGWLAQVTSDGSLNVSYNGQNLTNYQWDNDQTTLTPAAAAFIAVVVSVVTAGAGSAIGVATGAAGGSIFSGAGAAVATAVGASATGTLATAIGAGLTAFTSSVISGTIIGAINGDLDMSHVLLNALASGLTAGLTSGLNQVIQEALGPSIDKLIGPEQFGDLDKSLSAIGAGNVASTVVKIGVDSAVTAGIRAALLGEDFGDNFLNALKYNAANQLIEPIGFRIVGDMGLGTDKISNALMHAVVGAAGGALVNGIDGLAGGALGAFLGELVLSNDFNKNDPAAVRNMMAVQQIIGGLASLAVGDASMAGVDAAVNGFVYNSLSQHIVAPGMSSDVAKQVTELAKACWETRVCAAGAATATVELVKDGVVTVLVVAGGVTLVVTLGVGIVYIASYGMGSEDDQNLGYWAPLWKDYLINEAFSQRTGTDAAAQPNQSAGGQSTAGDPCGSDFESCRSAISELKLLHSDDTITGSNKSSYDYWSKQSTQDIIDDLLNGSEPILVKQDGTVMNGNTRLMALKDRGYDINNLIKMLGPKNFY